MLLKPNMVIAGKKNAAYPLAPSEVADATVRCFHEVVPAAVPGIVFLSGGQGGKEATANLDAINRIGSLPWQMSFSYGRALQAAALQAWQGDDVNVASVQSAYLHRGGHERLGALGFVYRSRRTGVIARTVRALVQRVTSASVRVGDEVVGAIDAGLCVLVGVTHDDDAGIAAKLAAKVANLRVFDDDGGVMNRSLLDTGGSALVVSQFTLYGDTERGRRPSWVRSGASRGCRTAGRGVRGRIAHTGRAGRDGPVPCRHAGRARERRPGHIAARGLTRV